MEYQTSEVVGGLKEVELRARSTLHSQDLERAGLWNASHTAAGVTTEAWKGCGGGL